jgi:hypothetical protein
VRKLLLVLLFLAAPAAAAESRLFPAPMVPAPTIDLELPPTDESRLANVEVAADEREPLPSPARVQAATWCSLRASAEDDGFCDVGAAFALWWVRRGDSTWAVVGFLGVGSLGLGIALNLSGPDQAAAVSLGFGVAVRRDERGIDATERHLVLGLTMALAREASSV